MTTKFELGEWVFVPGIIESIQNPLGTGGKPYYKIRFEGSMPFLPQDALINERAIKKATDKELEELGCITKLCEEEKCTL